MDEQQERAVVSWMKFLNPTTLRQNLISASIFLAAFESLKSSVIEPVKGFFTNGWDENGVVVDSKYQSEVLGRHKSPLRASLLWLREMKVVTDEDVATVDRIREHRNQLAHQLMKYITQSDSEIDIILIGEIWSLVTKIDRWWILNVEIPTNPDFDGQEIDEAGVTSGNMIFLQLMMQIAAGDESADEVYTSFVKTVAEWNHGSKASSRL